jgi:antitoxin MazE
MSAVEKYVKANKWGNSLGIRFPVEFTNFANITENCIIKLSINGKILTVEKAEEIKPYKTIEELFEGFTGEYEPVEIDWGNRVGDEIW